jgi:hypothetical protein
MQASTIAWCFRPLFIADEWWTFAGSAFVLHHHFRD